MKKLFTIITFVVALFASATTLNAQTYSNAQEAYDLCKSFVHEGNDAYSGGCFDIAQNYYEQALQCNMDYPQKTFISNKKLYKKISDCKYAIDHNGKTRQQENAETVGAILGAVAVVGAVATAATVTHHEVVEVHHHDPFPHHHGPHDPFGPHHHHGW